jgi:hypothetical protein
MIITALYAFLHRIFQKECNRDEATKNFCHKLGQFAFFNHYSLWNKRRKNAYNIVIIRMKAIKTKTNKERKKVFKKKIDLLSVYAGLDINPIEVKKERISTKQFSASSRKRKTP